MDPRLQRPPVPAPSSVRRVAVLSVHTSPLDRPGAGDGGGLNVYVREISTRLADRGVHVDVFTRRSDPAQPDAVEIADGVVVHHIDAGPARPVSKAEVANHLCAFVLACQHHPTAGTHDVLHAHYWLSGWVARRLAPRWGTPFVQTFHTLGVLKNATLAPSDTPEPALRLVAEHRVAEDADRVLVLTCGEARLLHRAYGLSGNKIDVVPAGVDLDRFRPAADRLSPSGRTPPGRTPPGRTPPGRTPPGRTPPGRTPPGRTPPGRAPRLLFVGRLQPLKGPDTAVRTFAEVRRRLPGARLRIVGGVSGTGAGATGPDELFALAEELGVADGVEIEDAVDQAELVERYRWADLLLAPSRSETFGLVALEAQACGTPVVAADVPGLESVVGAGGRLVPGHDPQDHARAAYDLLTDPSRWSRASAAGVASAQRASWDRSVEEVLASYATATGDAAHAGHARATDSAVEELVG